MQYIAYFTHYVERLSDWNEALTFVRECFERFDEKNHRLISPIHFFQTYFIIGERAPIRMPLLRAIRIMRLKNYMNLPVVLKPHLQVVRKYKSKSVMNIGVISFIEISDRLYLLWMNSARWRRVTSYLR